MLIVAGTFPINPERREDALAAITDMVTATEQEDGCITYRFYEDLTEPGRFLIYEQWESKEHLAAHFNTPHMATFRSRIPGLLAGTPVIKRYDIAEVSDL